MIESVRTKMSMLETSTKKIILKGTMMIILGVVILFIFISTQNNDYNQNRQDEYEKYLGNYKLKFSEDQKRFRDFVFYQTRD
jgi:hypothetical protein